jgi:NAD-dependent deacetylase
MTAALPTPARLALDDETRVLVLTGAGISKESGIPTFRDAGGLWQSHRVEDVASLEGFIADPLLVWRFYSDRRAAMSDAQPNAGHLALAALEARLGDRLLIATQNIDGLHRKSGSTRVVELHGDLYATRCSSCDRAAFPDTEVYEGKRVPVCGQCHARGTFGVLRPDIVWFGERLDPERIARIEDFIRGCAGRPWIFLAVGTSGLVEPAASFVDVARAHGAETWLVNAEPPANVGSFEHYVQGASATLLPQLLAP